MSTTFTQDVLGKFAQIGKRNPRVICESASDVDFGNASVTLELDDLKLHVESDRGIETLEIGWSIDDLNGRGMHEALAAFRDGAGRPTCPLEVLAIANHWIDLDSLIEHYDLDGSRSTSFKDPMKMVAPPYYVLADALKLLEEPQKWDDLVRSSKDYVIYMKAGNIEQDLQLRLDEVLSK